MKFLVVVETDETLYVKSLDCDIRNTELQWKYLLFLQQNKEDEDTDVLSILSI